MILLLNIKYNKYKNIVFACIYKLNDIYCEYYKYMYILYVT